MSLYTSYSETVPRVCHAELVPASAVRIESVIPINVIFLRSCVCL
jgi:hypothetical protein